MTIPTVCASIEISIYRVDTKITVEYASQGRKNVKIIIKNTKKYSNVCIVICY